MPFIVWSNTGFRLAMRRFLQADLPVPPRSDDELAAEIERNYRWNFTVNLMDVATFWFGLSFISSSTVVPLFISKLTDSPLPIGLAAVVAQSGWHLPQILIANVVERLPRKKPVVVNLGLFLERVPIWVLVVSALIAARSPALALAVFLLSYAWHSFGGGVIGTAWQDLLARCFPVERRGRFLGTAFFIGAGTGALGAIVSTQVLDAFQFPGNFVIVFAIAAVGITVSWFFLSLTREPVQPINAPRQSNRHFWASLPTILRHDHNFRRFFLARLTSTLGQMGMGFVTVAALQRWGVSDSTVGVYTASLLVGQTVGNLSFGFLADRFGHKLSLELSALSSFVAFLLAWLAPAAEWYYAVFVLLGISMGGMIVSGILVVMEFCEPQRRPTYAGMTNTGIGLAGIVAPLLGAWLAGISYTWLFVLSAAFNLAALVMLRWWVQEPRWAQAAVATVES